MRGVAAAALAGLALLGCRQQPSAAPVQQQSTRLTPSLAQRGRITDAAAIIPAADAARLTAKLAGLEQRTRHQLVIVTVTSLDGRSIDDYTRDLFNAWGVGRPREMDGVVLLVAPTERRVRIQVGYGLETMLTHDRCARIIAMKMVPAFARKDYARGIEAGTDALITALEERATS